MKSNPPGVPMRLLSASPKRSIAFVADYYIKRFLPSYGRPVRKNTRTRYSAAIKWLHRTLFHVPLLEEITPDNLRAMTREMEKEGATPGWQRDCRNALVRIARHAHEAGVLPTLPDFDAPEKPPEGTVLAFYETVYLPAAEQPGRDFEQQHRTAIKWLSDLLGNHAMPADLTEANLEALRTAVMAHGLTEAYADKLLSRLRAVWRHMNDAGWKEDRPGKRRPVWNGKPREKSQRKERFGEPLPDAEAGTVRHFFETVYRPQRLLGKSEKGLEQMRLVLRRMRRYFGRDILLEEQTDELACEYFAWLLDSEGLVGATVNCHRCAWFAIWRFAYKKRLVDKLPDVDKLPENLDSPDAWTIDEANRILEATRCLKLREFGGIRGDKFFRALLLVGYWTGLRRGSLFALRRENIDLQAALLTVPGSMMKNRRGKRFKLGPDAVQAVREIWLPERELLFAWPYREELFYKYIRQVIAASGVPESTRKGMHRMHKWRRTVATLTMANAGLEAACALMNHSGMEVTKRYIDPSHLPSNDATQYLPTIGG